MMEHQKQATTGDEKKRKVESTPPDGYVCRLCSIPGHWIQVCPTKKTGTKRQKNSNSNHVPVPGVDPSPDDIEKARELQKITPPKCFCGLPSRLNKVKRSKEGGETSRAIGKYFFFCSKKRDDETQCRFARPVEMELNKKKSGGGIKSKATKISGAKGKQQAGDNTKLENNKKQLICKFFAKSGSCKKGGKCEFSHDVQTKEKAPVKPRETTQKIIESTKEEMDEDGSSSSSSSSSDDSSESGSSSSS